MTRWHLNPQARTRGTANALLHADYADDCAAARRFFEKRVDPSPTPLRHLTGLAGALGLADVLLKDESRRFGLNAFKILGVSFALHRLLSDGRLAPGCVIVSATSGNHGRAVARAAREQGVKARIYVPAVTERARRKAIAEEGAAVVVVDGTYEDAVRQAAVDASTHGWMVIADTSWPGYEEIPRWIMAGYSWMLEEAATQWEPGPPPDVVIVQAGVGGLASAVASWFAQRFGASRPPVVVVEPIATACALESVLAGRPVTITGSLDTAMAGLRCAEISPMAWPVLSQLVDAFVAIDDAETESAMRRLAHPHGDDPRVTVGASGASGIASLTAIMTERDLEPVRQAVGLSTSSRALAIATEGVTDPEHYERTVGE